MLNLRKKCKRAAKRGLVLLIIFLMAVTVHPGFSPSAAQAQNAVLDWDFRTIPINNLRAITSSSNKVVAVGEDGSILSSADGIAWSRTSDTPTWLPGKTLNGVAWGNNSFVAVGEGGTIITSSNGEEWNQFLPYSSTAADLNAVAYGNNIFVAVGANGIILTSTLKGWQHRDSGTKNALFGVFWNAHSTGNFFVAVGENGTILTSANGIDWETQASGTTERLYSVTQRADKGGTLRLSAVGNGGTIITSQDGGTTWAPQVSGTTRNIHSVVKKNEALFVAVGEFSTAVKSTNLLDWNATTLSGANHLRGVTYYSLLNKFLAVGDGSNIFSSADGEIWVKEGPHWLAENQEFSGITYGNSQFKSVGTTTVAFPGGQKPAPYPYIGTSSDGLHWEGTFLFESSTGLTRVGRVRRGGDFIAVGRSGTIVTSPDGGTWAQQTSGTTNDLYDLSTRRIGTTGMRAIAVGANNTILTSDNEGTTWTVQDQGGAAHWFGITNHNNTLYAVGNGGRLMSSDYGLNWTWIGHISANDLYSVASGNNMLVAVGRNGTIVTSTDGVNWTARTSGTNKHLRDVTWAHGSKIFVAVGNGGTILTSTNGIHWAANLSRTNHNLHGVSSEVGQIIAVGDKHTIVGALEVRVTGVSLNETELRMVAGGDTQTLVATVRPSGATNKSVTWSSSDPSIATVSNGVVTPLTPGNTVITATTNDGEYTAHCHVAVIGVFRIAGNNRYQTAAEVSQAGWPTGAGTVILARADDFADALAGVPLAYHLDAPILLTRTASLQGDTRVEIERLNPHRVILLGGAGAISDAVKTELEGMSLLVERIAGDNRYATAVEIASYMLDTGGDFSGAFIAVGSNFADALAASSYAAMRGEPILLTQTNRLPAATATALTTLEIDNTVVCGGEGAVSTAVFDLLPNPTRIAGANRYATSTALAQEFLMGSSRNIYIATGLNFPDAIAGGVLAAKMNTGVLLVRGTSSEPNLVVEEFIDAHQINSVTVFGGFGVISSQMEDWFRANLGR